MKYKQISKRKDLWVIIISVAALSISVISLWMTVMLTNQNNWQAKADADQIYKLTTENAMQGYCIDNAVKPCTSEIINKHSESQ